LYYTIGQSFQRWGEHMRRVRDWLNGLKRPQPAGATAPIGPDPRRPHFLSRLLHELGVDRRDPDALRAFVAGLRERAHAEVDAASDEFLREAERCRAELDAAIRDDLCFADCPAEALLRQETAGASGPATLLVSVGALPADHPLRSVWPWTNCPASATRGRA
jgi:hypothetical protein